MKECVRERKRKGEIYRNEKERVRNKNVRDNKKKKVNKNDNIHK